MEPLLVGWLGSTREAEFPRLVPWLTILNIKFA